MEAPEMEAPEPVAADPEPAPEIAAPAEEPAAETVEPETAAPEIEAPKAEEAAAPTPAPEPAAAPPETKAVETPEKKEEKEEKTPEIKAKPETEAVAPETPSAPIREETAGYGSDDGNGGGRDDGGDGGDDSGLPPQPPKEPLLGTGTKMLVAVLGIIFLILIASSIANSNRYFIKDTREGIEIWRGEFSPKGKHKIATLINAEAPEDQKRFYSRNEAMALAFDHFMGKAEALMEDTDMPIDMRGIRTSLENATKFAITSEQKEAVVTRLKQVDFAMLIYRADIAAEKQTIDGYEDALDYLGQAAALDIDSIGRRDMVNAKIEHIQRRLKALVPEAPVEDGELVEDEYPVEDGEPETDD
jgi:colicin import membrane protein